MPDIDLLTVRRAHAGDYLGPENVPVAFGLSNFILGIVSFARPTVIGKLLEVSRHVRGPLHANRQNVPNVGLTVTVTHRSFA